MVTRSQKGILKPNPKYALAINCSTNTDPKNLNDALNNSIWLDAMYEKLRVLDYNDPWVLVPQTPDMNVVGTKWSTKQSSSQMVQ